MQSAWALWIKLWHRAAQSRESRVETKQVGRAHDQKDYVTYARNTPDVLFSTRYHQKIWSPRKFTRPRRKKSTPALAASDLREAKFVHENHRARERVTLNIYKKLHTPISAGWK